MKKILDYLEQLELSDLEAKLYLALLDSGPISVRDLAEVTQIKRTTAYFHIDLLVEKGLVLRVVNGSKKQIAPAQPESGLQFLVEKKLEAAKKAQENLPNILTTISASLPKYKDVSSAEIQYYKGKNGVTKIYEDALKAGEIRSYVNIEEVLNVFPGNAALFDKAAKHNPNLKMYEIVENSPHARERLESSKKKGQYLYKFLPDDMKIEATDILMYDGKVSVINLKNQLTGVVLYNKDLYNNFRLLFDLLWKMLP